MELTKEEEQLILEKRAREDEKKPKKLGYLKHDLYGCKDYLRQFGPHESFSLTQLNERMKRLRCEFEVVANAGTTFLGYKHEKYAGEYTYICEKYASEDFYIEGDNEWAKENLKDIVDI